MNENKTQMQRTCEIAALLQQLKELGDDPEDGFGMFEAVYSSAQ